MSTPTSNLALMPRSTGYVQVSSNNQQAAKVRTQKVHSIVSDRIDAETGEEEYLLRWKTPATEDPSADTTAKKYPPLSWHRICQLTPYLDELQKYVQRRRKLGQNVLHSDKIPMNPRKRPSPSTETNPDTKVFNGVLTEKFGYILCEASQSPNVPRLHINETPLPQLRGIHDCRQAELAARSEFQRRLDSMHGPKISLANVIDLTTPSLKFRFVDEYKIGAGVFRADPATLTGCQSCSPKMGRGIGCEYTKKCECLEYALVNEAALDEDQKALYSVIRETGEGSTMGLPKRFPYYYTETEKNRCLISFYLESRHPIYECNPNCPCGPQCKTRQVQYGRKIPLEIFKTEGRGWGLRTNHRLLRGAFIDTYRGEIITDSEASKREAKGDLWKSSYLYSLDKFAESQQLDPTDLYVVDGEFYGGPTRFINHSCEPNCRQYVVSYNKHDFRTYDIAFFAYRDIEPFEELTFDYLDKDEDGDDDDEEDESGPNGNIVSSPLQNESSRPKTEGGVPCDCGAKRCRKWLWS